MYLSEARASHSQRMWAEVSYLIHTPCTTDCLSASAGEGVFSGCCVQ